MRCEVVRNVEKSAPKGSKEMREEDKLCLIWPNDISNHLKNMF